MTTDSETMEQYLTFVWSRFLISVLVIGITADKNHIIFVSPVTRFTVATLILQNKPRFVGEKPRRDQKNPDLVENTCNYNTIRQVAAAF